MARDKMNGGYPLPVNPVVDSFVCLQVQIPNDPAYIAAVKGAITSLGQWFSWQRNNEEGGKIAAEIWRKTIFETLEIGGMCMDCCDDIVSINNQIKTIINNQSVNNITNTQNMVNDYSTIVSNYAVNAGNITILYPQVAAISPTTDQVMCLATKALVKMICDYRRERNKDAQVVNTVISVGFAIGAAAVTLFSGGTFLALGLGLASTGAALGATLYQVADAILDNTTAQKAVACAIHRNIIGVPVTKAVFETMADGLGFSPISSEGQIAELVRQFLTSDGAHATFMTMAEQQYSYAAFGLAICDCPPEQKWLLGFNDGTTGYTQDLFSNHGTLELGRYLNTGGGQIINANSFQPVNSGFIYNFQPPTDVNVFTIGVEGRTAGNIELRLASNNSLLSTKAVAATPFGVTVGYEWAVSLDDTTSYKISWIPVAPDGYNYIDLYYLRQTYNE